MRTDPYTVPDPARAALVVIDTQNDFTLPDAPACITGTQAALPAMARTVEAFRAAGRPVIHIVRLYRADGSNVDACRRHAIENGAAIARPDTPGAQIVSALWGDRILTQDAQRLLDGEAQPVGEKEWILYKPRWSAFHQTALAELLTAQSITSVVIAGCNFPNCPRATIYDASSRDLRVAVVTDALSGLYDRGLTELQGIGVLPLVAAQIPDWLAGHLA